MTDVRTRAAFVAAALVGVFLLAQEIVGNIVGLSYGGASSYLGAQIGSTTLGVFVRLVPIVIGVFLVFWRFLAPITAALTVKQVLVRSLVATAAGDLFASVIGGFVQFVTSFGGYLFGNSFPFSNVGGALNGFSTWLTSIVTGYVSLVPLVALAAVLLWLWLRDHRA
jgi:hypothetical protein